MFLHDPLADDPRFDDSHRQFRDVARAFAEQHIAPYATEWEEAGTFPRQLYLQAAEAGLMGPTFPEHLGGGGGDADQLIDERSLWRQPSLGCPGFADRVLQERHDVAEVAFPTLPA